MTLEEAVDKFETIAKEYAEKLQKNLNVMEMIDLPLQDESLDYFMTAEANKQVAEWLKELKKYKIKFEYIISQLEERARQLEYILEKNSWCDGDEEYRLDEINSVVEFIKKIYELKSVLDIKEINDYESNSNLGKE